MDRFNDHAPANEPDYRRLFEGAPAPYIVLTPDFTIVAANAARLHATMTQREQVIGKPLFEMFPDNPEDETATGVSNLRASLERVLRNKIPDAMPLQKYDIPKPGGGFEKRYWAPLNTPILDEEGNVAHILHWAEDVTALVKTREYVGVVESELRAATGSSRKPSPLVGDMQKRVDFQVETLERERQHLRSMVMAMPVAVAVTLGPEHRFFLENDAFKREFRGAERIGETFRSTMRALAGDIVARMDRVFATGHPDRLLRQDVELGSTTQCFNFHWQPLSSAEGVVEGVITVAENITESERRQSQLQESEAKFRTITEAMPQIVWSAQPDGYHDFFNDRWFDFTGVPKGAALGDAWSMLFHPADRERVFREWQHSLETGEPYAIQFRLLHRDGDYRWVLGRALPVRDEQGRILRWMGTSTDIHEQVLAQEVLHENARRKDEFLAMLAHELRNPLAPIRTAASVLANVAGDAGRTLQLADVIARQARHMTRLVDDLLDVSRVTRGLVTMDFERLDLKAIVLDAIEQVRPLIEERHHALSTWMAPEPIPVRADRTRMIQVVANLLNNAAKFTAPRGRISVSVDVQQGEAVVIVRDNGSGIEAELLPRVFELFAQGSTAPDRAQGGLGIGLALARSISRLHGGTIAAHSDGRGQGSEFTVRLPLVARAESGASPESATISGQSPGQCAILLVDDNRDAAQTIAMSLEIAGHTVTVCHDAASTLAETERNPAPVYVMDIGLPDMSGYELAKILRRDPRTSNATLIALTGYGRAEDRERSREAGFDSHLVKPVDVEELRALIAELECEGPGP